MTNKNDSTKIFALMLSSCFLLFFAGAAPAGEKEAANEGRLVLTAEKLDYKDIVKSYPQQERRRIERLFQLIEDENTETGQALRIRLDKKRVREKDFCFFQSEPRQLPVGRYRATVRMKIIGMLLVLGTPIYVDIGGVEKRVEFRGYQFENEDTYQEFSFEFDVIEPDVVCKRPRLYRPRSPFNAGPFLWKRYEPMLEAKRRHNRGEFTEEKIKERQEAIENASVPEVSVSMGFGQTKRVVSKGEDTPANTIHSVTIDRITIEKQPEPAVRAMDLLVGKRWLIPGQTQDFRVWLAGRGKHVESCQLNLYLERGLEERRKIGSRKLKVKNGAYKVERFTWESPKEADQWGYAAVAEITSGGRVISSARDVFTVQENNVAVKILGGAGTPSYTNHIEVFGCTPGDCAEVHMEGLETPYQTGMSGYITNNRSQRAAVAWSHELGVATVMYLFPGADGNWAADLYLRHPEWFKGRLNFSDYAYKINAESARKVREAYKKGEVPDIKKLKNFHLEVGLTVHDRRLLDRIVEGVIANMKEIGYDGIRWDGGPTPVYQRNALGEKVVENRQECMERAAENFAYMKKKVAEAGLPHFFNGFNGDTYGFSGIIHSLEAEQREPGEFPQFAEMMKDGGLLMDESFAGAVNYRDPANRIHNFLRSHVQMVQACRKAGGHFEGFPPNWRGNGLLTGTDVYWYLCTVCAGAHIPARYPPLPYSEAGLAHFLTRFCEFVWDGDLTSLPDAADAVRVDSPRPLWYRTGAVWKKTTNRCRIVIPLLNPPPVERFLKFRFGQLPEPIEDPFEMVVTRPDGYGGDVKVFMLSCEPRTKALELAGESDADEVYFEVPDLKLFRFIVVEFSK
ncbi:MAG: hypothetical protein KGZ25_01240 [Planctomycetes bacterium]|nr:hypothetical protein [Planctomycetota bacterium]